MRHQIITSFPGPQTQALWLEMLEEADMATHYTSPEYFNDRFVGDGERFAVLAVEGEDIAAVMTGIRINRKIVSGFAVRPQAAFRNGVDRERAFRCLIDGIREFEPRPELVELHLWPAQAVRVGEFQQAEAVGADRIVMIDLKNGADAIIRGFSERRRTQVRKAAKQGLFTVKDLETADELAQLYSIHCDWCGKKGIAPDDESDFAALIGARYRKTLIAIHEGKVIAGTYFRYFPNGVIEYAANNSAAEWQKLHPNELLTWRAIEWACASGLKWMSMGASHPFLARFGGEIWSTCRYRKDNTFLRLHANRERLDRIALRTYNAIPETLRRRLRAARAA